MKRLTILLAVILGIIAFPCTSPAQGSAGEQFARLASLVGTWHGTTSEGKKVTSTYELVSNGSAIMERLSPGSEPDMITMYHRDGDHLMMTHYCSAGNQPRMRAEPSGTEGNVIRFSFLDATNLKSPDDGHMQKLVFIFRDKDHMTQEWTWREKGQEKTVQFELTREK